MPWAPPTGQAQPARRTPPPGEPECPPRTAAARQADQSQSLICPSNRTKPPAPAANRRLTGQPRCEACSHLHAFFSEVFRRARMPGDRRVLRRLIGELDGLGLAMHGDQIVLVLDEGFDDVIGDL